MNESKRASIIEEASKEYHRTTRNKQYHIDYRKSFARALAKRYGIDSGFFVRLIAHNNTYDIH